MGEYLSDELRERGWAIVEFAEILGRPVPAVAEILNGRKEITPTTAKEIAAATGTSAETWLRLQDTYRLCQGIVPLAALADRDFSIAALRQAAQRGRLEATQTPDGIWRSSRRAVREYQRTKNSRRPKAE